MFKLKVWDTEGLEFTLGTEILLLAASGRGGWEEDLSRPPGLPDERGDIEEPGKRTVGTACELGDGLVGLDGTIPGVEEREEHCDEIVPVEVFVLRCDIVPADVVALIIRGCC